MVLCFPLSVTPNQSPQGERIMANGEIVVEQLSKEYPGGCLLYTSSSRQDAKKAKLRKLLKLGVLGVLA